MQDGWSSFKEVTLKDMSSDEKYDPDTVYGERLKLSALLCSSIFTSLMVSCKFLLNIASDLFYCRVQFPCSSSRFHLQTLQQILPL